MTCPAHPSEDLFRERLCVCRLLLAFAGSQVEPFIAAALLDFLVSVVGELVCWKLGGATCCCRSVLGAPRKMGRGFPWSVSQLRAATTAEGWHVTTRKLSFPHTDTNQLARLIFRPLSQQNFSDRKNRCDSQASSSFGHSGRSLKVNPET